MAPSNGSGDRGSEDMSWMPEPAQGSQDLDESFTEGYTTEPKSGAHASLSTWSANQRNVHSHSNQTANPNAQGPDYGDDAASSQQSLVPKPNTTGGEGMTRHTKNEWEEMKSDIKRLYVDMDHPLPKVIEIMADEKGFHANESMYKRKIDKWGWKTYTKPDVASTIRNRPTNGRRNGPRTPALSASTIQSNKSNSDGSSPSTIATRSPQHHDTSSSTPDMPTPMSKGAFEILFTTMLFNIRDLYVSQIQKDKWKVKNEREVEEDDHDDLLVGVGVSLRSLGEDNAFAHKRIHRAFQVLKKVVGATEGNDCGFFSLPAIWESYLRMIRVNQFRMAQVFLSHAIYHAERKFGKYHFFVQSLALLQRLQNAEPRHLQNVILRAYWSCINHAENLLGDCNITFLSLWADFVVYLDESSANEAKVAVRKFLEKFQQAVQKSGKENGEYDDYTLKLLGMILYVQQSTPSMAEEAGITALDMIQRVERRTEETGEKLEGELFIIWKDLLHTLGAFCHVRGDDRTAVGYLELYLSHGVVDERDLFALQKLEEWYENLGDFDDALRVRQWRLHESEVLLKGVVVESLSIGDFDNAGQEAAQSSAEDGGDENSVSTAVGDSEDFIAAFPEKGMVWEIESVEAEVRL